MTKEDFLKDVANWDNHRHLLWPALEATKGDDVIEMGMGDGSTPQLHQYCETNGRNLFSYENNLEWAMNYQHLITGKHKIFHVNDWDQVHRSHPIPGVVLIDHAPGERRKIDIVAFSHSAKIIVCHDTEPAADHGYQMRSELLKFKYIKEYQSPGAWSTVVSNFIDVSKFEI